MKRVLLSVLVAVVGGGATFAAVVFAQGSDSGARHENMRLIANYYDGGTYRNGTALRRAATREQPTGRSRPLRPRYARYGAGFAPRAGAGTALPRTAAVGPT